MGLSRVSDHKLLFSEHDLDSQLHIRQTKVRSMVDEIPKDQFLVSTDQEIVEHIVSKLEVSPLELHLESKTMTQNETEVDVSGDPMRFISPERDGPVYIPGTRVDVNIPFTGDEWIFRYKTNPISSVLPHAEVNQGYLRISVSLPHDVEMEKFKEKIEYEVNQVKYYVENSRKQVETYNQSLQGWILQAICNRRERLDKHADIAKLLNIPITAKKGLK